MRLSSNIQCETLVVYTHKFLWFCRFSLETLASVAFGSYPKLLLFLVTEHDRRQWVKRFTNLQDPFLSKRRA